MPIARINRLFQLIKSLTAAEKRSFRLYATRNQGGSDMKFLQLFDVLDKQKTPDENAVAAKLKDITRAQLPNIKRHLYSQILAGLHLLAQKRIPSVQGRDYITYAEILYERGLYLQSLKILEKALKIAEKEGYEMMKLHILEKQKLIEARHITRTGTLKNEELMSTAEKMLTEVNHTVRLSNLKMKMHSYYIVNGHIGNREEYDKLVLYFERNLPRFKTDELDFKAKIYLHQACVWYYYALSDFPKCYESALQWVNLYRKKEELLLRDPDLLMRGYHYVLISAYYNGDRENFTRRLEEIETFRKKNYARFRKNSQILSFLTVHTGRLNRDMLYGDFAGAVRDSVPRCLRRIKRYARHLDVHRILVFYYKISWIYLADNQPGKAVDFLQKIFELETGSLREDLQGYSRIMHLMAHYDLGNYEILAYLVRTEAPFFRKMKEENPLQQAAFRLFKKLSKSAPANHLAVLRAALSEFETLENDRFRQRALLYLNVPLWILSKTGGRSIGELVRNRQN